MADILTITLYMRCYVMHSSDDGAMLVRLEGESINMEMIYVYLGFVLYKDKGVEK